MVDFIHLALCEDIIYCKILANWYSLFSWIWGSWRSSRPQTTFQIRDISVLKFPCYSVHLWIHFHIDASWVSDLKLLSSHPDYIRFTREKGIVSTATGESIHVKSKASRWWHQVIGQKQWRKYYPYSRFWPYKTSGNIPQLNLNLVQQYYFNVVWFIDIFKVQLGGGGVSSQVWLSIILIVYLSMDS